MQDQKYSNRQFTLKFVTAISYISISITRHSHHKSTTVPSTDTVCVVVE